MATTPRLSNIEKSTVKGKINTPFAAVPNTTINGIDGNPRRMADLTQDLKVLGPVERIMFTALNKLDNEFGSAGETVYEADQREDRVRFVGDWSFIYNTTGSSAQGTTNTTDYFEVTFYGTGLNMLGAIQGSLDVKVSIDGAAEVATAFIPGLSTILNGRNYDTNTVGNIVSGLSLGRHTVKIRCSAAVELIVFGIEILNENAQLTINPGQPFQGGFAAELATQKFLDYKPATLTGGNGGRVVAYITEEGVEGQAIKLVDAAPAYLGATDHSNEEIVDTINWRRFGANRTDDLSTLVGVTSDRAFTLDDGSMTLVANNVASTSDNLTFVDGTSFLTITFIGTGLDFSLVAAAGVAVCGNVTVDGSVVGTWTQSNTSVCSGLPYGSHTVKIDNSVYAGGFDLLRDLIIYQPKRPATPANAIELADYNVMADDVPNATVGVDYISQGVLRKFPLREMTYVEGTGGTSSWATGAVIPPSQIGGFQPVTDRLNAYYEFTFFGTGFDLRFQSAGNRSVDTPVLIDGLAATTANFASLTSTVLTGTLFAAGLLDPSGSNAGSGVMIRGLDLGKHTVRVTNNTASSLIPIEAFDIVTPIHVNNTKVGSLSLEDLRSSPKVEGQAVIDPAHQSGLQQYDLVCTGGAGHATQRANGIPYQQVDGSWRIKGNIYYTFTSTTSADLNIIGIKFPPYLQAVTVLANGGGTYSYGYAVGGTNKIGANFGVAQVTNYMSFDLELAEKPDFVK